jgi:hypothetical protein
VNAASSTTLAYEFLKRERVLVSCSGSQIIADDDWRQYVRFIGELGHLGEQVRVLAWNPTHMPTRSQYDALRKATRDAPVKVSIIATGFAMSFVGAALKLVNKHARMFAPAELNAALLHLGLTSDEARLVRNQLQLLMQQVS